MEIIFCELSLFGFFHTHTHKDLFKKLKKLIKEENTIQLMFTVQQDKLFQKTQIRFIYLVIVSNINLGFCYFIACNKDVYKNG
jgi:hypothetical protein